MITPAQEGIARYTTPDISTYGCLLTRKWTQNYPVVRWRSKVTLAIAMAPTRNAKVERPAAQLQLQTPRYSSKYSLVTNQLGGR